MWLWEMVVGGLMWGVGKLSCCIVKLSMMDDALSGSVQKRGGFRRSDSVEMDWIPPSLCD